MLQFPTFYRNIKNQLADLQPEKLVPEPTKSNIPELNQGLSLKKTGCYFEIGHDFFLINTFLFLCIDLRG